MNRRPEVGGADAQRAEARLRLALDTGGLGVWEWDRSDDTIIWDRSLETMFGLDPGQGPTDFETYLALIHPDDRDAVAATIAAALDAGEDFDVEHRLCTPNGDTRWVAGRGRPIHDGNEIVGMIGITADITSQRGTERERDLALAEESAARAVADAERARLEFLIDATTAVTERIELNDRLEELTRLSIPRLADGSAVHLLDPSGEPQLIAIHHRDPEQVELIRALFDRYPVRLDRPGIGAAITEGRSGWLPEVTDQMLINAARSERHLELLRALDLTAGLVVPLLGPSGVFGAITFITTGGRHMSETDLTLVEQLCARIAVLLRNAQLLEARELEREAHRYQAALLQTMFEASVDGILAVGPNGDVLSHNQRFLELWGLHESLIDQGDDALLEAALHVVADPESFVEGVMSAYEATSPHRHDEVELANGRLLDRHGSRLTAPDGEYLGYLWSFRDITLDRAKTDAIAEAGDRAATLSRTLQQSLLPPRLPKIPGVDLAAHYHAAGEGLDVGGDFYDVFAVDDVWILVVGDVCGKGAEAAATTALARYTIRAATSRTSEPEHILSELNTVMVTDTDSQAGATRFATVCCIRLRPLDDGIAADVACGGHPPPTILRADGTVEECGTPGTLIGVFADVAITTVTDKLAPGDSIICVTDGVLEARDDNGRQFEIEGLARVARTHVGRPAREVSDAIALAALDVQHGVAHDDIAILVATAQPMS